MLYSWELNGFMQGDMLFWQNLQLMNTLIEKQIRNFEISQRKMDTDRIFAKNAKIRN